MGKLLMTELQESLALQVFGMTKAEAHRLGVCIDCKRAVDKSSMSEADKQEYEISGICPDCFPKEK